MKRLFLSCAYRLACWFRDVLGTESNQSSMRLVFLASWCSVLGLHLALSLAKGVNVPIDNSELALLGIVTGGKCWQNHVEVSDKVGYPK